MSSPDTNTEKQKRRHRGPIIGMLLVAVFGIGLILYWVGEEIVFVPGAEDAAEETSAEDIREGNVEVPAAAPDEQVAPGDPDVEIAPSGPDPTDD